MYYKLNPLIKVSFDSLGGCLYDCNNSDMIFLDEEYANVLKKIAQKSSKYTDREKEILKNLQAKGYVDFYDSPVFIEEPRFGMGELFNKDKGRVFLSEFYIQISNKCNLDCVYCSSDNYTFRKEGCKCWNNNNKINVDLLKSAIQEAYNLECSKISLIGGEPFLNMKLISEIINLVKKFGIQLNIYTNLTLLDDKILSLLKSYSNINLIIDIVSLDKEKYMQITHSNYTPENIIKNINLLKLNNINFELRILISKYNEEDLNLIKEKLLFDDLDISEVKFVYPTFEQDFSSKKYQKYLDYFTIPKGNPTLESMSFLEKYNNCLIGKIYLNLNGDWTPCPMMNTYVLGNIKDKGIGSILSSEKYKECISLSRKKLSKCKNCSFHLNCIDCRALSYSQSGKLYEEYYCSRKV